MAPNQELILEHFQSNYLQNYILYTTTTTLFLFFFYILKYQQ